MIIDILDNDEVSLSVTDRMRLGRRLGVPTRKLEQFELEALSRSTSNSRRVALTKIVTYWLDDFSRSQEDLCSNSLENLAGALDEMIGQEVGDRIRKLIPVENMNILIKECDVEPIINLLESSLIRDNIENEQLLMTLLTRDWLRINEFEVTWQMLIDLARNHGDFDLVANLKNLF